MRVNIRQLKYIILEYKEQLRRMKIIDIDSYPIILNISNETGNEDGWEIDEYKDVIK